MQANDSTKYHVVLNSGGPDSLITHFALSKSFPNDIIASVYYDLGHRYSIEEKLAIVKTVPDTMFLDDLRSIGAWEEDDANIHFRNIFLILAVTKAFNKNTTIYLSVQKDEMDIPDRKPLAIAALNSLLGVLGVDASAKSLWTDKDKTEMVKYYATNGGNMKKLFTTWSCYKPEKISRHGVSIHCGDCPACIRRHIAFTLGAGEDRTNYKEDPRSSETASVYVSRAVSGFYSEDRCKRILSVLK